MTKVDTKITNNFLLKSHFYISIKTKKFKKNYLKQNIEKIKHLLIFLKLNIFMITNT